METSPKHSNKPNPHTPSLFPSSNLLTRSESSDPYPTTFVNADTSSFKHVVQMLTGSPKPVSSQPDPVPKSTLKRSSQSSSGFKLYERRSSVKHLHINPLNPIFAPPVSGSSTRNPDVLSPSLLDFPALVLSPVTPLLPDPFARPRITRNGDVKDSSLLDTDAEDKAIKEKGFYLHPSPATTPREAEPRLLPLFPVTSLGVSGSDKT